MFKLILVHDILRGLTPSKRPERGKLRLANKRLISLDDFHSSSLHEEVHFKLATGCDVAQRSLVVLNVDYR